MISLQPVAFGILTLFTLAWIATAQTAAGQNTGFTYQGRLNVSGSPANGVYDFTFQAFDAVTGGASFGGTVNVNGVGVSDGLFTAVVDLGSAPFTGPARWLQIRVSTNGAGSFTLLTPRQPLTPSPYAIYANTAGTVTNGAIANPQLAANAVAAGNVQNSTITAGKIASGQVVKSLNGLTDAVSLTQGANVTINTLGNSLQISAPAGGLNLPSTGSASSSNSIFTLRNSGSGPAAAFLSPVGIGTTNPQSLLNVNGTLTWGGTTTNFVYSGEDDGGLFLEQVGASSARSGIRLQSSKSGDFTNYAQFLMNPNNGFSFMTLGSANGFVGIGTTTPQARLDVRGDVRLGRNGQYLATSGEENLRIVRGTVATSGIVNDGNGFTATRLSLGEYRVTFATPFFGKATITVTPLNLGGAVAGTSDNDGHSVRVFITQGGTRIDNFFDFIAIGPR